MSLKNEVILIYPGPLHFYAHGIRVPEFYYENLRTHRKGIRQRPRKRIRGSQPLGLLALASALKTAGFIPIIIDGRQMSAREELKTAFSEKTLFVGISSMTSYQIGYGIETAKLIRKWRPDLPIVWGGLHVTVMPEQSLATSSYIDVACIGEGDETIVELANVYQGKGNLGDVAGIAYKSPEGIIVSSRPRAVLDFATQAPYDYSILPQDVYDLGFLDYQASRGCVFKCKFCEVGPIHGWRLRRRSTETILNDLERLEREFGVQQVNFIDELFFASTKRAIEFATMKLEMGLKFRWRASCRADYFRRTDKDYWKLMVDAGLDSVYIGAESGSQRTLDNISKGYRTEDILNAVNQLEEAGIESSISFVIGFPDETQGDMQQTIDLVDHVSKFYKRASIYQIFAYLPLPGTEFENDVIAKGASFPVTLEAWGKYMFFDPSIMSWNPLSKTVFRVGMASQWIKPPPLQRVVKFLKNRQFVLGLMWLCGWLSSKRWDRKFFAFPVDIYVQFLLNKYYFRLLWHR